MSRREARTKVVNLELTTLALVFLSDTIYYEGKIKILGKATARIEVGEYGQL